MSSMSSMFSMFGSTQQSGLGSDNKQSESVKDGESLASLDKASDRLDAFQPRNYMRQYRMQPFP